MGAQRYGIFFFRVFNSISHTVLTRRSRLYSRFKKRMRCHSFMALNRASDASAANWRSQTHVKFIVIFHVWRFGVSQWWESL